MPCFEGKGCGGEGVVLPFEQGRNDLDEMFGFSDVEKLPLSDEVLPVIFDGALLTEEGLLDCFARHYPERAAFLLQLTSDQGPLALGYRFEFTDAAELAAPMAEELARLEEEYRAATQAADEDFYGALGRKSRGQGVDVSPEALAKRRKLQEDMARADRR